MIPQKDQHGCQKFSDFFSSGLPVLDGCCEIVAVVYLWFPPLPTAPVAGPAENLPLSKLCPAVHLGESQGPSQCCGTTCATGCAEVSRGLGLTKAGRRGEYMGGLYGEYTHEGPGCHTVYGGVAGVAATTTTDATGVTHK